MKKNWLVSLFVLMLVFALAIPVFAANDIKVKIDGVELSFNPWEQPPIIQNDTTLVPMRAIFQALGATVDWDSANKLVTGKKGDITVVLKIDSATAQINGKEVQLSVPATIIHDNTMVPLRFISESFDYNVAWDEATKTVSISTDSFTGTPTNITVSAKDVKLYRYVNGVPKQTFTKEFAKNVDENIGVELILEHEKIASDAYKTITCNLTTFNGATVLQSKNYHILIKANDTTTTEMIMAPIKGFLKANPDIDKFRINIMDGKNTLYSSLINLVYDSTEDEAFAKTMTVKSVKFFGNKTSGSVIDFKDRVYSNAFFGHYQAIGTEVTVNYPEITLPMVLQITFKYSYPSGYEQTFNHNYVFNGTETVFSLTFYMSTSLDNVPYGKYDVGIYVYNTLIGKGAFTMQRADY